MRSKLLPLAAALLLVLTIAPFLGDARPAAGATIGTITVDAASSLGSTVRLERYNNLNHSLDASQIGDLASVGTENIRIFMHAKWWYPTNDKLAPDFSHLDLQLRQISTYAGSITFVIKTLPPWLTSADPDLPNNWDDYQQMITAALLDYKQRFPKLELIEANNEPTVEMSLSISQYMEYYRRFANAIAYVNANRPAGSVALKIGGPVVASFDSVRQQFIQDFLDAVVAEGLPLDYLSWHYYHTDPGLLYEHVNTVNSWLSARGLAAKTALTEYGYRKTVTTSPTAAQLARQAAYSARISRAATYSGLDLPMNWDVNHHSRNFLFDQYVYVWQSNASNNNLQTFDFSDQTARYVMFEGIDVHNPAGGLALSEVDILGTSGELPVSSVSASWNYTDATKMIDNDLGTHWTGGGGHPSKLAIFDLGSNQTVASVKAAFFDGASKTYKFSILTSTDQVSWTRVVGGAHPYPMLNLFRMTSLLKDTYVSANSDSIGPGATGLHALATKDGSGSMAILVWNYQNDGTATYDATLNINNLPAALQGDVRVERYLVDETHSNYAYDPAREDLEKVADTVLPVNSSAFSTSFPMARNSVSVVVLTPASSGGVVFADDFEDGDMAGWSTTGGSWSVATDGGNHILSQTSGSGEAIAVAGDPTWTDYTYTGQVRINSTYGNAGLLLRYTDASNFYMLRLNNNDDTVDLYKRITGTLTLVASQPLPVNSGQWYTLQAAITGNRITGSVNGVTHIDWTNPTSQLPSGNAGFRMHTTLADFDNATVTQ